MTTLRFFVLLNLFFVSACVTMPEDDPSSSIYHNYHPEHYDLMKSNMVIKKDSYTGVTSLQAPVIFINLNDAHDANYFRSYENFYTLFAATKGDLKYTPNYRIRIKTFSKDWVFWNSAYANGKELSFKNKDRIVLTGTNAGNVTEEMDIMLNLQNLIDYSKYGLSFKLKGRTQERIIVIPASYFLAFFDTIQGL